MLFRIVRIHVPMVVISSVRAGSTACSSTFRDEGGVEPGRERRVVAEVYGSHCSLIPKIRMNITPTQK